MTDQVIRKLKSPGGVEANAEAAPSSSSRKVRRVRKVTAPPHQDPVPVKQEPPVEKPAPEPIAEVVVPASPPPELPAAAPLVEQPMGFPCLKCGIELAPHTEVCPICGERYIELPKELLDRQSSAAAEAESADGQDPDAGEGVLEFLEKDSKAFEVALICSECGTALEFATDTCPLCGTEMDSPDAGLVGLISEMTFDEYAQDELDCPQCGERVKLAKGKCPSCKSVVMKSDPHGILRRIDPVIHGDNVVFLHLDVGQGELKYLQKSTSRQGLEKTIVRLEAA